MNQRRPDPSPDEIAEATAQIRAGWSELVRESRRHFMAETSATRWMPQQFVPRYTVPEVQIGQARRDLRYLAE